MMQRCRQCDTTMTPDEVECINCGARAKPDTTNATRGQRFRKAIKFFFLFSAGLSAVSLLTPWGPPFMTSICVTFVLLLVKSSADEMIKDAESED